MTVQPSVTSRFLARLLADSVADKPDELAEEHVKNDARLARGESLGLAIAEELRRAEIERTDYRGQQCSSLGCARHVDDAPLALRIVGALARSLARAAKTSEAEVNTTLPSDALFIRAAICAAAFERQGLTNATALMANTFCVELDADSLTPGLRALLEMPL